MPDELVTTGCLKTPQTRVATYREDCLKTGRTPKGTLFDNMVFSLVSASAEIARRSVAPGEIRRDNQGKSWVSRLREDSPHLGEQCWVQDQRDPPSSLVYRARRRSRRKNRGRSRRVDHAALDFLAKVATLSRWRNGFETRMPYHKF